MYVYTITVINSLVPRPIRGTRLSHQQSTGPIVQLAAAKTNVAASNGILTHDHQLPEPMLYKLSY